MKKIDLALSSAEPARYSFSPLVIRPPRKKLKLDLVIYLVKTHLGLDPMNSTQVAFRDIFSYNYLRI